MNDLRIRSKTSLSPRSEFKTRSNTQDTSRLLSNAVLACGAYAANKWLFERGVGSVWLAERVLLCAALGVALRLVLGKKNSLRRVEWPLLALSSFLNFIRILSFCAALPRLGALRLLIFTYLTPTWIQSIVTLSSVSAISITIPFAYSLTPQKDTRNNSNHHRSCVFRTLRRRLGDPSTPHTRTCIWVPTLERLATGDTIILSMHSLQELGTKLQQARAWWGAVHPTPTLPIPSFLAILVLATGFFLAPGTGTDVTRATLPLFIAFFIGPILFRSNPGWTDLLVAGLLSYGASFTHPCSFPHCQNPTNIASHPVLPKNDPREPRVSKDILLFGPYMCYMLVQMLYGIWTNSLGLISDAIHMAFDCMAIAVGLLASVMATWPANDKFTYGYGRIETLSGFANGIFLILISIFIIFEAIQRLLDPPEMNTSQLLLVSGLGLGVNLFGMFAMGGHHHGVIVMEDIRMAIRMGEAIPILRRPIRTLGAVVMIMAILMAAKTMDTRMDTKITAIRTGTKTMDTRMVITTTAFSWETGERAHCDHGHSHDSGNGHSHNGNGTHGHSHDEHGHGLAPLHVPPRNSTSSPGPLLSPTLPFMPANMRSPSPPPAAPPYSYYSNAHGDHDGGAHNHEHDHGQSHNMRGVFLHVMADTLGSVGVIISTLLIQWYGWTGFDPIASLFIAILIAASVVPLVIDCAKVLSLDVGERETSIRQALIELSNVDGLASYSAPRFWPKDGESLVGSIHIQLAPSASSYDPAGAHRAQRVTYANADRVVDRVEQLLRARIHGLHDLTIQVEGSRDQPWCSCLNDLGAGRGI
ncbi:Cation efflux family [Rhizoctonia solani]|uniref:Cation efflux family n=1 Tax=Rhizoctonia solani TaxID=456999 RepID=A0A8H7IJ64_9AGAM|nr:Cation efflux family [Rhizoctonia solani]